MKLPFGGYGLRQGFEHYDGLVGARHDGFGNGDEFVLLAEYTQPRRLQFTAIELGRRAGRRFDAARLKLREHDIELRAVTYALFDHRQHVDSRKSVSKPSSGIRRSANFPACLASASSSSVIACSIENSPTAVRVISARCAPHPSFCPISCASERMYVPDEHSITKRAMLPSTSLSLYS